MFDQDLIRYRDGLVFREGQSIDFADRKIIEPRDYRYANGCLH